MRIVVAVALVAAIAPASAKAQSVDRGPETMVLRIEPAVDGELIEYQLVGASESFNPFLGRIVLGDTVTFYGARELTIRAVTERFSVTATEGSGDLALSVLELHGADPHLPVFSGRHLELGNVAPRSGR